MSNIVSVALMIFGSDWNEADKTQKPHSAPSLSSDLLETTKHTQ